MEKLVNVFKWLNGKKTYIGAALYGISLILSELVIGIWQYNPEWVIKLTESFQWGGGILAGIGVTHALAKGKVFTKSNTPIYIIAIMFSFGLSSCVSMNSAINWAKKNGTVTQATAPNGVVTTTAKVQGFYNPTKIKEKFSKFLVEFNAILPSLTVTTATKDTTTPIITPTFKR